MTTIAPIKTDNSYKNLWFDANDVELKVGDKVIVQTARGQEFGTVAAELFEPTEQQLKSLKSELQPVKRIATEVDLKRVEEMKKRGDSALPKFRELAQQTNPDMVPVSVEYLFDGRKAVFYFSAPERQDFRDLVKKLSSELNIRVDMHQIIERDKAKLVSGIGICGQELCCARIGKCPKHVSIKMAKVQGLSLNPENISGCCGKLLCCLDYEFDMYDEFAKRAPKLKAKIDTPEGVAVVTDVNMPNETIQIKYGDPEKRLRLPLSKMKTEKKKGMDKNQVLRPNTISKKAWEDILEMNNTTGNFSSVGSYEGVSLKGNDKVSSGEVKELPSRKRRSTTILKTDNNETNKKNKHNKNRRKNNKHNRSHNHQNSGYSESNGNARRRRSRTITVNSGDSNHDNLNNKGKHVKSKIRPGQHSSGLQNK